MIKITPEIFTANPERAALILRIEVAGAALNIPKSSVRRVILHGTPLNLSGPLKVLIRFAGKYGISLDYLINGDLVTLFRPGQKTAGKEPAQ